MTPDEEQLDIVSKYTRSVLRLLRGTHTQYIQGYAALGLSHEIHAQLKAGIPPEDAATTIRKRAANASKFYRETHPTDPTSAPPTANP